MMHRLRIEGVRADGHGARVWLDDQEVKGLVGVRLSMGVHRVNRVALVLYVESVNAELDAETTAAPAPPAPAPPELRRPPHDDGSP